MFTTRRRSKRKILILMASFAAAIVAVFGVCGIILGQTKADMSKLALQTIENTLTSESEAVTVEIADSSFVGGSFGFGDSANVIIENCTLSNSEISVSGGNVTIVDSSITRNGNGNGLSVTGGNVTIVDSSISGCSNGIYVPTITEVPTINLFGSTTISGCSDFGVYMAPYISATLNLGYYMQGESDTSVHEYSQFSGSISGNGTGIYSGYNATTNIYAGEVKNNTNYGVSLNDSGHLYMIGNGSVSGSKIGVYLLQDSTFTLYGGSIKENRNTDGNGGGIYVGSTCTLSMSEDAPNWSAFVTNNSANNGAGVYVESDGNLQITTHCYFNSNTATSNGGGIYSLAPLSLTGGTYVFENNEASSGGAIYGGGNLTIDGSLYLENNTAENGSNVYGSSGKNTFSGYYQSVFTDSYFAGGSCSVSGSDIVFERVTFSNSPIGVVTKNSKVSFVDSSISGSGISTYNVVGVEINLYGSTTITGCSSSGVAMNPYGSSTLNLGFGGSTSTYPQFSGSISENGEGLASCYGGTINIYAGEVKNNTGFGVYLWDGASLTMNGGTISGNRVGVSINNGSSFTLKNGTITQHNNAGGNGGGVFVGGGDDTGVNSCSLEMTGGTISSNKAANGAGIYIAEDVSILGASGVSISDNTASSSGGGIYFAGKSSTTDYSATLSSVEISGNKAVNGGACFAKNMSLTLSGTTFSGNSSSGFGGAVYFGDPDGNTLSGSLVLNATFMSNSAIGSNGGAIYARWATVSINGGTFGAYGKANSGVNGGAIFITNSIFRMSSGTFDHNTATNGGGIYFGSSNVATLSGGTISNNYASSNGGGVFVAYSNSTETVTLSGATISNNTATDGGGVYVSRADSSRLGIFKLETNGKIAGNTASGNGGGIYSNGTLKVSGGYVGEEGKVNTATNGGGIFTENGKLTMSAGTVAYNTATNGGGIYFVKGYESTISGGTISSNSATSGGGIYVAYSIGDNLLLSNVTITSNTATDGGGVYVLGGVSISGGKVISNTASGNGGGIYSNGWLWIAGGVVGESGAANTATSGGGVFTENGKFKMSAGTVAYNTATNGGGIYFVKGYNSTTTEEYNSIISGGSISSNSATSGGGIYLDSSSSDVVTLSGGTISSNSATDGGGVYALGVFKLSSGKIIGNKASGNGGGICSNAKLTISGGYVGESGAANTAKNGGGVYSTAEMYINGASALISYNTAKGSGGGVFASDGISMSAGGVSFNTATEDGGGIYTAHFYSSGSATVNIIKNTAKNGGGLFVLNGLDYIDCDISGSNTNISNNTATNDGGGILLAGARTSLSGTLAKDVKIENNTAGNKGGGIFSGTSDGTNGSVITISNTFIYNNSAVKNGGGLIVYKAKAIFNSGTLIQGNHVDATSGSVSGGGLVVDSSTTYFNRGASVYGNYIQGSYSYAGGAGLYVEGSTTVCTLDGAKFEYNYISASSASSYFSAGGNIFVNSDVSSFKTVTEEVTVSGDGNTTQAKIGGGLFIYTPEYGFEDIETVQKKFDLYNIKFTNCIADYGGAIAAVGSFKLWYTTITGCEANTGIGDAIFLAGMLVLDQAAEISGDIAVASNETYGNHREDYSTTILGSKVYIPYRTGSIYVLGTPEVTSVYELTFCDFTVSVTGSISVSNTSTNCDYFYNESELLLRTSYASVSSDFTPPSGYIWLSHYTDSTFDGYTLLKKDLETS